LKLAKYTIGSVIAVATLYLVATDFEAPQTDAQRRATSICHKTGDLIKKYVDERGVLAFDKMKKNLNCTIAADEEMSSEWTVTSSLAIPDEKVDYQAKIHYLASEDTVTLVEWKLL
jgi:hypothetical protein